MKDRTVLNFLSSLMLSTMLCAPSAFAKNEFLELSAFATLMTQIEADPTFRELAELEEVEGGLTDIVHQSRLKLLRRAVTRKYGFEFQDLAPDAVARAFALGSPVDDLESSRVYIAGRAIPLLRQLAADIARDKTFREMVAVEAELVRVSNLARVGGTRTPSFVEYHRRRDAFEARFRERFQVLKYAFGVKSPKYVHGRINRARAFPIYQFVLDAPFFKALDWDVLVPFETVVPGTEPLPYVPYLEVIDDYLSCEKFFD